MAPKRRKSRKTSAENPKKAKVGGYRLKWLKAVSDFVSETQTNVLNFFDKGLKKEEVKAVLHFLPNSQVTELNLAYNFFLKNGMADLAPLLTKTKIRKLNVFACGLTKDDVLRLAEVLKDSQITDLIIGEPSFTDRFSLDEASEFVSHLQKSKLTTLRYKALGCHSFFEKLFPQTDITSYVGEFLNTSITCVDLSGFCLVNLFSIFVSLSHSSVTELNCQRNEIICEAMQEFSEKLAETKIEKLTLNRNRLTDRALNLLVDGLVGSKVTELNLQDQHFSNLSSLFTKIKETQIRTLNLDGSCKHPLHQTMIYPDCFRNSCLASLSLRRCDLSDEQGKTLMNSLRFSNVTILDVHGNYFGILTVKQLAKHIKDMNLLDLDISYNQVPFEGFSILGECLKRSKLTRIDVSCLHANSFTPSGNDLISFLKLTEGSCVVCVEMADFPYCWNGLSVGDPEILVNSTLTELHITSSIIKDDVSSLLSYLKFTSITYLDLSCNGITDVGVEAIAGFLKDATVRKLDLKLNKITSQGAKALALTLKDSNLLFLDLRGNQINDEGLKFLAESIEDSFVTELDVSENLGKKILLVDKVLWENKIQVHRLVGFFKQIKPQSDSQEFCFDQNSSDSDVSTFLEKCWEFYKTVIDKPKAINVLQEEASTSYFRTEIRRLLCEEFPRQLSSFIACRIDAELTERVKILKTAEEMGLTAIVESLLLHRPVFTIDEEQGILHPYVYQLLLKYKQPVCNLAVEPDGVTKIINYFTEHADVRGSRDLIKLLRTTKIP